MAVLLVLPESGFTRIHQSPEMEGQGICLTCERLSFFQGLQENTEELLVPVRHEPRILRDVVPKKSRAQRSKVRAVPRSQASPKSTAFRGSSLTSNVQAQSGSDFMKAIARAARAGRGHAPKAGLCYVAVKNILRAVGLPYLPGASAIDAYKILPRYGFRNDMQACGTEGTIRVYRGPADGMTNTAAKAFMNSRGIRYSAGDNHGHIEVVGGNGRFYYSPSGSDHSLDQTMGRSRRHLVGCFIK